LDKLIFDDGLLHSFVNFLGNLSAFLDSVGSVLEDLWLNNWDKTGVLADGSISCERVSGLFNGLFRWAAVCFVNLDNGSPLSESDSHSVVLFGSSGHTVETHSGSLVIGSFNGGKTGIDLDSGNNALGSEAIDELSSVQSRVSSGLVIQDGS
jgi:hypothetical protein